MAKKTEKVEKDQANEAAVKEETKVDQANEAAVKEEKKSGGSEKTDRYKQHIQAIIKKRLGVKVSKQVAWELFKDIIHGSVQFTLNEKDHAVPLAGVGTFKVLETKPRKTKAEENWEYVPRFRFYPSSVIDKLLEQSLGFAQHGVEVKNYGIFATGEDAEVGKEESAESNEDVEDTEDLEEEI